MAQTELNQSELLAEIDRLRDRVKELEAAGVEHRKTAEELFHSRQMLQLVLDTIPQRVFWKARDFTYLGCNRPFANDAGLPDPDSIVGKNDFELGWKEVASVYREDDRLVMESDTPKLNYEEPQVTPDGGQLWLRTSKVPLHDRDGSVIGVMGTYEDITERKRIEKSLSEERAMLRTMIDNIPDRIYAKDLESRFILCNRALARRMGMAGPDQIIGKSDFDFLPQELAARFRADEQAVIVTGEPLINREEPLDSAHGTQRWNLATKVPLRDSQGNVVGSVGVGRDITDLKKAEIERERLIQELQKALADVKMLSGLLPICSNCKKVRDDGGYWRQIEAYITDRSDARFSHSICPTCAERLYPEYLEETTD